MKRMILCKPCSDSLDYKGYSGSYDKWKSVSGSAIDRFGCDLNGCEIQKDDFATAFSFWSDSFGTTYQEWEKGYIHPSETL